MTKLVFWWFLSSLFTVCSCKLSSNPWNNKFPFHKLSQFHFSPNFNLKCFEILWEMDVSGLLRNHFWSILTTNHESKFNSKIILLQSAKLGNQIRLKRRSDFPIFKIVLPDVSKIIFEQNLKVLKDEVNSLHRCCPIPPSVRTTSDCPVDLLRDVK